MVWFDMTLLNRGRIKKIGESHSSIHLFGSVINPDLEQTCVYIERKRERDECEKEREEYGQYPHEHGKYTGKME